MVKSHRTLINNALKSTVLLWILSVTRPILRGYHAYREQKHQKCDFFIRYFVQYQRLLCCYADGLVFRFADGSNFSVQTLTDRSTGHAGVNMHTWPEYLLGLKTKGPEPESYVKDLKLSGEHIIKDSIAPTEIRRFSTKNGTGYWAVGKEKSAIVLTNTDITDQITVIYTKDMSESKILNTILNGVSL